MPYAAHNSATAWRVAFYLEFKFYLSKTHKVLAGLRLKIGEGDLANFY